MDVCFNCKTPETKAILSDVVSSEGIVKACGVCMKEGGYPLVEADQSFEKEKIPTVAERLSKISNVRHEDIKPLDFRKKNEFKEIVDKNYNFKENPDVKERLIHNFHWVVMRARRGSHLTQGQLAERIREPEIVVKKIEAGFAPEKMITMKKIEEVLRIRVISDSKEEDFGTSGEDNGEGFDITDYEHLTLSDLQDMKKKKDAKAKENIEEIGGEDFGVEGDEFKEEEKNY